MAFNASTATLPGWLAIAPLCGLPIANFAPSSFEEIAQTAATQSTPPGAPSVFVVPCTASLMARGIIYYKNAPGDCGRATTIVPGDTQEIASGISAMAGAIPLPGIGSFVQAITNIFGAAHTAAVQTEQATICQVAGVINQVFAYYDAQVKSGAISPSTAYVGLQAYIAQVNEQLSSIAKKCDAACVYMAQLAAHSIFVQSYYPAIAPVGLFSGAPGAAPATGSSSPGGVIATGEGIATGLLSPLTAATGLSASVIGIILLALFALFGLGYWLL